jgi:hypothetical protein
MQGDEHGAWVSLSEAAELLECSVDTVRRRLKRGDLEGRKLHAQSGYRWQVRLGSLTRHTQVGKSAAAQADTSLVADQTQRQLEVLRDTLVMPLIHQNHELHREVGAVREELGRERERREQLEREREYPPGASRGARSHREARNAITGTTHAGYVYREPELGQRPWWKFW